MKKLLTVLFLSLLLPGCKNDPKIDKIENGVEPATNANSDSIKISDKNLEQQTRMLNLKRRELLEKQDQRKELENLVISKSFFKEANKITIDLNYPYLNEKINPSFGVFNEYIRKNYLDVEEIEKQINEEKRLCDSLGIAHGNERKLVEYKIYNLNDRLISVLFYMENHFSGAAHASYTFKTLNFDLEQSSFMNYEDFFNEGTEEELRGILNEVLLKKINSGEMYYDCWEISTDDFFYAKNNFVITDDTAEFYFDDCVICPSYTGTYSIQIPLEALMPVLRNSKKNPLLVR